MALALADRGVRVNAVGPGTIATELARAAVLGSDEARERILSRTPLRRLGEPDGDRRRGGLPAQRCGQLHHRRDRLRRRRTPRAELHDAAQGLTIAQVAWPAPRVRCSGLCEAIAVATLELEVTMPDSTANPLPALTGGCLCGRCATRPRPTIATATTVTAACASSRSATRARRSSTCARPRCAGWARRRTTRRRRSRGAAFASHCGTPLTLRVPRQRTHGPRRGQPRRSVAAEADRALRDRVAHRARGMPKTACRANASTPTSASTTRWRAAYGDDVAPGLRPRARADPARRCGAQAGCAASAGRFSSIGRWTSAAPTASTMSAHHIQS